MPELRVGQPYFAEPQPVPEGMHVIGLSAERMEVLIAFRGLDLVEVELWKTTPIQAGLATHGDLIVFLVQCLSSNGWMDAPFDIRLCPSTERTPPPTGQTGVAWLLLDADTSVIRAIRFATLARTFMGALRERVEAQLRRPSSRAGYDRLVDEYQARFSPEALARRAWVTEVVGTSEVPGTGAVAEVAVEAQVDLDAQYPWLDSRIREVLAEAIARGEGHLEEQAGETVWVDTEYDGPIPLRLLRYDEQLGMVDSRQFPAPPQA